jgi:hypothetical protein
VAPSCSPRRSRPTFGRRKTFPWPSCRRLLATDSSRRKQALDAPRAQVVLGGEKRGRRAGAVGGDHVGAGALVEAVSKAPRPLGHRRVGPDGATGLTGDATLQISGLCGVRVRREQLHPSKITNAQATGLGGRRSRRGVRPPHVTAPCVVGRAGRKVGAPEVGSPGRVQKAADPGVNGRPRKTGDDLVK